MVGSDQRISEPTNGEKNDVHEPFDTASDV